MSISFPPFQGMSFFKIKPREWKPLVNNYGRTTEWLKVETKRDVQEWPQNLPFKNWFTASNWRINLDNQFINNNIVCLSYLNLYPR